MATPEEIHQEATVVDNISVWSINSDTVSLLKEGGIDVALKHVSHLNRTAAANFEQALTVTRNHLTEIHETPGIEHAKTTSDIDRINGKGNIAYVLRSTNGTPFEKDRDAQGNAKLFKELGINVTQITYNHRNYSGDGVMERYDGGLSNFGLELIDALESEGIVVDIAHAGRKTALDIIEASSQPVINSHSCVSEFTDHPRSDSDEIIKAIAETGGTMGIAAYPPFFETPDLESYVDQMEYIADLVGPSHVNLGLDINTGSQPDHLFEEEGWLDRGEEHFLEGLKSFADVPKITTELHSRGFDESEIVGILGENVIGIYETVW